jgi:hypothetical protein
VLDLVEDIPPRPGAGSPEPSDQARQDHVRLGLRDLAQGSGWKGGGLPFPASWQSCWAVNQGGCVCPNVHHPDNHYLEETGEPLPIDSGDCEKITGAFWYKTSGPWYEAQTRYMGRVIDALHGHNNVTLEIINEAPDAEHATNWRKEMHQWIRGQCPEPILLQSEGFPGWDSGGDVEMRRWGSTAGEGLGTIDMTSSHGAWNYSFAEQMYRQRQGRVLPGCNEAGWDVLNPNDLARVRQMMWGLTMAGGAAYIENVPESTGAVVTNELHRFFYPPDNQPRFWEMSPKKAAVRNNDFGHKYVLTKEDMSELLVFSPDQAPFEVVGAIGPYRYRWFNADGSASSWDAWRTDSSWYFTPPAPTVGLQIIFDPNAGPTCGEKGPAWFYADKYGECAAACGGDCIRKQVCGANGERCQPNPPGYCWYCPSISWCGDGACTKGETCYNCPQECPCVGKTCGEMGPGWYYNHQTADCERDCEGSCQVKFDCNGGKCLDPYAQVEYCLQCPALARCGDGACQGRIGENCSSCPGDCGPCQQETNTCGSQGFYDMGDYDRCVEDCGECTRKQDCGGLPCEGGYCWRCG